MFKDCSGLITAPSLPSTTLGQGCYYNMFSGCTNLVTVPKLPATTMVNACYGSMFEGCTSLCVQEVYDKSDATWDFSEIIEEHKSWNSNMLIGLTAEDTVTEVQKGKMYKVSHVNHGYNRNWWLLLIIVCLVLRFS